MNAFSTAFRALLGLTGVLWFGGLAATATGQTIVNPSFETDASTGAGTGPITGWPFTAGSGGISDSTQPSFADNGAIPDGTKVAFVQGAGTMHQVVSGFTPGLQYRLRYYENARICCGANTASLQVTVGGVTVVAAHTVVAVGGTNPYVQKTTEPFTATAASLDVAFAVSGTGDFTVLLDKVEMFKSLDVTSLGDSGPGSLRQTILDAPAGSTITFAPALEGTVAMFAGKITIDKNLTIIGPGSSKLTLRNARPDGVDTGAGWENRVLSVSSGATVAISGLSVRGGRTVEVFSFPAISGGAGIKNNGTLTLTDVTVSDCITKGSTVNPNQSLQAPIGYGGGILSPPATSLALNNCTITNNQADTGGGVCAASCAINNSFITGNVANAEGGGGLTVRSYNSADVSSINNSTISGNTAQGLSADVTGGGGIRVTGGTVTLTNTTVSGNDAHTFAFSFSGYSSGGTLKPLVGGGALVGAAGGYPANPRLILLNSTVTNNVTTRDLLLYTSGTQDAGNGAGVYVDIGRALTLRSSIVARNLKVSPGQNGAPADFYSAGATVTSQGYNLFGAAPSNITGTTTGNIGGTTAAPIDPNLAPLGFYGGVTPTCASLATSPAVDAGDTATAPAADQRGAARVGTVDIGAFESNDTYVMTLPQGALTVPYSFTLVPNNNIFGLIYTYAVTSGALPAGITVITQGSVVSLSGTPTAAGTFDFTITGSSGANTYAASYRLIIPMNPAVNAIDPPSGSMIGGDSVTISGSGFTGATSVSIGGTPVLSYTIASDTSITAVTPAHGVGAASVAVAIGDSASAANPLYTYTAVLFTQGQYDASVTNGRTAGRNDVINSPGTYNLYTAAQYTGNYTSGQNSILNSPNSFNLYSLSQVQTLNADVPLLAKDPATGKFKLTLAVKKTTNPVTTTFTGFPMNGAGMTTAINAQGQLEFTFPVSDNAAFFRVEAQ